MNYKLTPKILALLGTAPDTDVGRWSQVNPQTISAWRKERGIPRWRPPVDLALLGTMSDYQLADLSGCSHEHVRQLRLRHGIESWGGRMIRERRERRRHEKET